jgi:xylulokinase
MPGYTAGALQFGGITVSLLTMKLLGLDIGSASVRAGVIENGRIIGRVARASFATKYDDVRAEVDARQLLRALGEAIAELGERAKRVETIAVANMAPSWVAMDGRGRALTPIVTHQDRRSVDVARELEKRVGKRRHLKLAGNRPFPGGISSTTWAWHLKHAPQVMKKADLCGHVNTFLHRQLTAARVTDPSNASFMGFYSTLDQGGWSEALCDAVGIQRHRLPQVIGAEGIGGMITRSAGERYGLRHGTPMLAGCVDGSGAVLLAGNEPGQLANAAGSTDVLALCTDKPRAHERLLTRAVGVGRRWVSVATLAAAGSSLKWAHAQLFADLSEAKFYELVDELAGQTRPRRRRGGDDRKKGVNFNSLSGGEKSKSDPLVFEPYLAGDRMEIEQRAGAFSGLTLATDRRDMLRAVIEALARTSAQRVELLREVNEVPIGRRVVLTGGASESLHRVLQRDWPGRWSFQVEDDATLRGLWRLVDG